VTCALFVLHSSTGTYFTGCFMMFIRAVVQK